MSLVPPDSIDTDAPRAVTATADRAFEVVGAGMGLAAVRLRDDWAQRELKITVRHQRQLSSTGRLVLDHLRAAEQSDHAVPACNRGRSAMASRALTNCYWAVPGRPGTAARAFCGSAAAPMKAALFAVQQGLKITPAKGAIAFGRSSLYWCGRI
jgi:hypothetical protein